MRPAGLETKIFIDGGNPEETREIIGLLGFLDGQTTNPTLLSKNPEARERLGEGERFCPSELLTFYKKVVQELSVMMPKGSISVEVYAVPSTQAKDMLEQGKEMFSWIPNAHVKFPTSHEGLTAASQALKESLRINMTLCFSQSQAAAVYSATRGAKQGDVYVSPFIGRLDDRGENGMDVVANILKMYRSGDGHVEVLTASVRSYDHLMYALKLGSDIITAPYAILKEWGQKGLPLPAEDYVYNARDLEPIPYQEIDLGKLWQNYDITHDLTAKGMEKFSSDWDSLITG